MTINLWQNLHFSRISCIKHFFYVENIFHSIIKPSTNVILILWNHICSFVWLRFPLEVHGKEDVSTRFVNFTKAKGSICLLTFFFFFFWGGGGGVPGVVVSTAAFHVRVRGSVPGLGGLKETKNVSSPSTCESQYCGELSWPRGSVLGLRPSGLKFRILCLEDSVISIISPSSLLHLHDNINKYKWNESGFRPPLCTYRLNWARRTSWGWWDDWDDTVLQTQDSKFEPWRSEAEHATSRSRRLPTILTFTRGWGRNNFVSFKPPRPGTEPRTLAWKAAVLTTTLGPPPCTTIYS